ncbi:transposable element Tc3 transposase [Trichonephila clavipes]|nr:transposable element Tc3 transposase [Trichonephila clavipes]
MNNIKDFLRNHLANASNSSCILLKIRRTVRTEEAATVERSIEEDPNESIHHRAQELDQCPSTLWKILQKDLGLCAYKIQLVQELKPNNHQARLTFVEWAQNEIAVVPDLRKRILFSDEAHFWLNGKRQQTKLPHLE